MRRHRCTVQANERFVTRFDDSNDSNPAVTYFCRAFGHAAVLQPRYLACCRLAQATVVVNVVELIRPSSPASVQARSLASEKPSWSARLDNAYGAVQVPRPWWLPLLRLRQRRRPQPCNCFGPPPPFASSMPAALATLASKSARLWFSKDVLETAWLWPLSIAENGTGLHRTARRTRPSTHRLAAAVDAADARVALPCHIALDQRPRTRGRLWNTHPAVARSV